MGDTSGVPEDRPAQREVQELVTLAEIGRRVGLSKERVSQLSKTDPAWPVPRDQWKKLGPYWQLPWPPVEAYFAARKPVHGVHRTKLQPDPPAE
jgi:hypothetical protein